MKRLLSPHSLAGIARELLVETHQAATTKVNDLRVQVEDLWAAAGERLPRAKTAQFMRHLESAVKALRNRDTIGFPSRPKA
jgi:hypothetical protein